MSLRTSIRPLLVGASSPPRVSLRLSVRFAHAATASPPEEHQPTTSGPSTPSSSSKGKGRASPLADQYRFPDKGRNGGPPDPFEVLALDRNANEKAVKQQYYRLALLLHPDSSHPSASPEHFSTLNRAYTLLSNPSKRNIYLSSGIGWAGSSSAPSNPGFPEDVWLRAEAMRRRSGGAARSSGRSSFRPSEAGRSAWGGFYDGGWQPYQGTSFQEGDERFTTNNRFLGFIAVFGGVLGWIQYHRLDMVKETRRDMMDQQHMNASHALAQARHEAKSHGHERRERIRRRINEAKVLKEVEKMERGE